MGVVDCGARVYSVCCEGGGGEKRWGIDVRVEREGLYSLKPSSHDMSQIREL